MDERTRNAEVVGRLASTAPAVDVVFREHLADMGGELLPYVFMDDLARWVVGNTPVSAQSPLPEDVAAVLGKVAQRLNRLLRLDRECSRARAVVQSRRVAVGEFASIRKISA
jgi:hypothetical protein